MKTACELRGSCRGGEWQHLGVGIYKIVCLDCGKVFIISMDEIVTQIKEALQNKYKEIKRVKS